MQEFREMVIGVGKFVTMDQLATKSINSFSLIL